VEQLAEGASGLGRQPAVMTVFGDKIRAQIAAMTGVARVAHLQRYKQFDWAALKRLLAY
jgi:hypothetical protein